MCHKIQLAHNVLQSMILPIILDHPVLLLIVTNFIAIFNVIVIICYFKHLGGGQVFKLSKTLISIIQVVATKTKVGLKCRY